MMRTSDRTIRKIAYLIFTLTISAALAACGGGGGSSTSPGTSGPSTVSVSIASAPSYPAGTTFATSTASPAIAAPPGNSTTFDNVLVTVTKLALIPSSGPEFPDGNGELEAQDSPSEKGKGFVTDSFTPITIDLLHLSGDNAATLLNKFDNVPAGEYSKIRVYYNSVVGQNADGDTTFHPTAHYHLDVHFVGGNLFIPFTSDSQGGIRFYSVEIGVVGLKTQVAGQSGNVLLRPQVFAEVVSAPQYIVSGVAQNVNPADKSFEINTPGGTIVSALYGAVEKWIYIDNTVDPENRSTAAGDVLGSSGLDNGARVDVIGTFSSDNVLLATEVDITFPDLLTGKVYLGWDNITNTFDLRIPADDNTVFPKPTRTTAYYDNAVDLSQLFDTSITDNASIIARGYKVDGGINAYWITIGRLFIPGP